MNTITNDLKKYIKTARCVDPEIDGNQQANLKEQENMSTCVQTRVCTHEGVVFDTNNPENFP